MSSTEPLLVAASLGAEGSAEPLVVNVVVRVDRLLDLDTIAQTFTAKVFITAIVPGGAGRPELVESMERVYFERFSFLNAVSEEVHERKVESCNNTDLVLKWKTTCTFEGPMELSNFPVDVQGLTIELTVNNKDDGPSPVKLVALTDRCVFDHRSHRLDSSWNLDKTMDLEVTKTDPALSSTASTYPILSVTIKAERRSMYYMWNVVVPMMSFVIMSFTSHAVPATDAADRLSLSLTLVLTGAAYKFVVAGMLPAISYTTMLDGYVMWCSFFLFLVVMDNAVMSLDGMQEFENISLLVVIISFVLLNAIYGFKVIMLKRAAKRKRPPSPVD